MPNKYFQKTVFAIAIFLLVMYLSGKLLEIIPLYERNQHLLQGSFRLLFFLIVIYCISREHFLNWKYLFRNKILSVVVSALILYGSFSTTFKEMAQHHLHVSNYSHYSYFFASMSTGFLEEFFFRVLVFGYICKAFESGHRRSYYKEVVVAGVAFGAVHLFNAIHASSLYDLLGIVNQILFASCIGITLQCLFFRLNNIILIAIIHGIINYNGTRDTKLFGLKQPIETVDMTQELLQGFLVTGILIVFITLPTLYICVRNRQNKIVNYSRNDMLLSV